MQERVFHTLAPLYGSGSKVLILGTMPSPKSREAGFYYAHPQNRFWPTLAAVYGEETPQGTPARAAFAQRHGIALWDVLASCVITGAADSTIREAEPNDIAALLAETGIHTVFTTGKTAYSLYKKYCFGVPEAICLPSPSAANCAVSLEKLTEAYRAIKIFTDGE